MNLKNYYEKLDIEFNNIQTNSKQVKNNDIFIAIKGKTTNGHKYIKEALDNGAIFIISQETLQLKNYLKVKNTKIEANKLLSFFYKNNLNLIGVTGTDGKTTTSYIIYYLLNTTSTSSYIGTNGIITSNKTYQTINTTPSNEILHKTLHSLSKKNYKSCVMEVSSEGILDNRVDNISFKCAIFTNLSHEHLNTHKTMRSYFNTKNKLFKSLDKKSLAIINNDDKFHKLIKTKAKIITYGINKGNYQAKNIILDIDNTIFDLYINNKFISTIKTLFFGKYNIYNTLAAIAYIHTNNILGINAIKERLLNNIKIDGRFDLFIKNKNKYIIDFAHTPNAIYNLLTSLKQIKHNRIIHILGSAGEKDKTKRNKISNIACSLADIVIFTSEDPKNESILNIFSDLVNKLKYNNYYLCLDRKKAIKLACSLKKDEDIILITGKGSEKFENILGHNIKHNDLEEIKKALGNP